MGDTWGDGTPEEDWLTDAHWAEVPSLVLSELDRLVVVAAHPNDASLGASGLIARASRLGVPVHIVVGTDGDASLPGSPVATAPGLSGIRKQELLAAVDAVAPGASVDFLDLPDGRLRHYATRLEVHLRSLVMGEGTLVVAPWRRDGHGDHDIAGAVAARVARGARAQVLEYPVLMWQWARPDDPAVPWGSFVSLALDDAERAAKSRAIAAHVSHTVPLSDAEGDEPSMSAGFTDHFERPFEVFVMPIGSRTPSSEYFDDMYENPDDPWGFSTRWYEVRKRAIAMASLPRPLFSSGLEIGCSIGVLTSELAGRCVRLVATDIAEQPLSRARARLIEQSHVALLQVDVPNEWLWGSNVFDLIVLCEAGYYWSPEDLQRAITRIDSALTEDGVLLASHWRHPVAGYPERGDEVHAALRAHPSFSVLAQHVEEDFVLDVLVRPPAHSVARQSGLL